MAQVVILNQYFPPDAAATAAVFRETAEALAGAGHEVAVIAGRPSYDPEPSERRPWRPRRRSREGQLEVTRVGSTAFDRRRAAGRALNYLTYLVAAAAAGWARAGRADCLVVGSDPPLAVVAAVAAARGRPVVYALKDLHPEMALASGALPPSRPARWVAAVWERAHTAAMRRAAAVVVLGEDMAELVRAKGVAPERVQVIWDGAWPPAGSPDPAVVASLRGGADFVVVHAGNLGWAGAWETLAEAARHLGDEARFLFVGDGARAAFLRSRGCEVVPFRPAGEVPSVMAAGDLQVVTLREGLEGLVVPSKLFTALAHGRPVLAVVPEASEVARIVKEWGCGLVVGPDDAEGLVRAIRWARGHRAELGEMAARATQAARHFHRGSLLRRFVAVVEQAATRPSPAQQSSGRGAR